MKAKKRVARFQEDSDREGRRNKGRSRRDERPLPRLPKIASLSEDGFGSWAKSILAFVGVWFTNLGRRFFRFWFSKRGVVLSLKIWGTIFIGLALFIGVLFLWFARDIAMLSPDALRNKVISTTNIYLDRNGVVLWEDRGDGDYRIAVEADEISQYAVWAVIALEDRNFENHIGVSPRDTIRALWMTLTGQQVQGGSTITQQLVNQVFFGDEPRDQTITGVPRKVREIILAMEVERRFTKEEIMTMYLNQSPFGGRRNGIESGARAYFGKSAAELTIAEAALLVSIPQNPSRFTPFCGRYETPDSCNARRAALLARQRHGINAMVDMGFITREQADEALTHDIIATIRPMDTQFTDIQAPHFVVEVRRQLEEEFGVAAVRAGGWRIYTTLDIRAQRAMERAVAVEAPLMMTGAGTANNMAGTSVDVDTGQVIAMVGSIGWDTPGYGQTNAARSLIEPGSTIKNLIFAELFNQRAGRNFGPGSIIRDENIEEWYGTNIQNTTSAHNPQVTIRHSLGASLNRPAVKAMDIIGVQPTLQAIRNAGNHSYCAQGWEGGLSAAIGNGCNVRMDEHTNALATLARGGNYKPLVYILRAVNGEGRVMRQWNDVRGVPVFDPQAAYMAMHILHDPVPRRTLGAQTTGPASAGWITPGVWTGTKTGTSTGLNNRITNNWFTSVSPVLSTSFWCARHDGQPISRSCGIHVRRAAAYTIEYIHHEIYIAEGRYRLNQPLPRPAGIHTMGIAGVTDIASSWTNRGNTGWSEMDFEVDTATRRLATRCTLPQNRTTVRAMGLVDQMSGTVSAFGGPEGWDLEPINEDNLVCGPAEPPENELISGFWNSAGNPLMLLPRNRWGY
ncbi:penicillin-binding protein [Candidatus Saccharibacteria bacterium]|nr:penicillin-binding protein [Candidatus Saccharibacteria bacterium]